MNRATGLKLLDLSGNKLITISNELLPKYLTSLTLNQNAITCVDISNLLNLKKLNLNKNQLTNLDISGCQSLKVLQLKNNLISDINLNSNASLVEVDI